MKGFFTKLLCLFAFKEITLRLGHFMKNYASGPHKTKQLLIPFSCTDNIVNCSKVALLYMIVYGYVQRLDLNRGSGNKRAVMFHRHKQNSIVSLPCKQSTLFQETISCFYPTFPRNSERHISGHGNFYFFMKASC